MSQPTQQKALSSVEKELFQGQPHLLLELKYQRLQQAYHDVCLERDLLQKVLGMYTNQPNTNEGRG